MNQVSVVLLSFKAIDVIYSCLVDLHVYDPCGVGFVVVQYVCCTLFIQSCMRPTHYRSN